MANEEEQVQSTEEEKPTEESPSVEGDEPSSTEKETESEEKEGDFEEKVTRVAQSIADKSTKTITRQRDDLQTKLNETQKQLSDKVWNKGTDDLFNENVENLGEDKAKVKDANLKIMRAQVDEFKEKNTEVNQKYDEIKIWENKKGAIERDQKAQIDLWPLVFSEDKKKIDQINAYIKKFEKAEDMDDYDIIFEGIKETMKAKKKPFVPDSSTTGGAGGAAYSSDNPAESVNAAFEKLKRKK